MVGTVHVQTGSSENAASQCQAPSSPWLPSKSASPCAVPGVPVDGSSLIVTVSKNMIMQRYYHIHQELIMIHL